MTHAWKKRYAFRLQEEDEELAIFLEQVPNAQTSKVIREMLRFAYRQMKQDQQEQKQFQELLKEIRSLRESNDATFEAIQTQISQLSTGSPLTTENNESQEQDKDEQVPDEKVKETAQAMLSSFGLQD
ncbi:hypothetical protein [Lentibacillus salinarum]|uniref:Plasmid segregation centromere-binding protein ParR n=1 Tax=Lentibacillus salinarum TaxID=446820 RepID=A0ABW3ZYL8_9BACI